MMKLVIGTIGGASAAVRMERDECWNRCVDTTQGLYFAGES